MGELIKNKLLECGDKKIKVTTNHLQKLSYFYGFITGIDEDNVILKLDRIEREVIIDINFIVEVVVYEN